ncbi:MAG TPA: hypothetical protein VJ302_17180 [Blastocatellia bacterium]|nr:hypothetical protein [Blastocatellia bacterium]
MLLRIIDKPAAAGRGASAEIRFERDGRTENFTTEPYRSPITVDFQKTLAWYFERYPQGPVKQSPGGVAEQLVGFGQALGYELLGEEHQLARIAAAIDQAIAEATEKGASPRLKVRIESSRPAFFAELWEILVLPGSKYVLSSVTTDYVRQFKGDGFCEEHEALDYDLKVTRPVPDLIAGLNQEQAATAAAGPPAGNAPLRILHVVSRARAELLSFTSSNAFNWATDSFGAEGAIDYEVWAAGTWEQLRDRLADRRRPVQIVHYDGPLTLTGDSASILLDGAGHDVESIPVADLSQTLIDNRIAVLCVDARGYFRDTQPIRASIGLSAVASAAGRQGLGNLIGLGHLTDPWTSGHCFQLVYTRLAAGLSVGQAVVEARKALQSRAEISRFTPESLPFHPWSLLVHYGGQPVTFFKSPQTWVGLQDSQTLARTRQRLLGFKSSYLPPLANSTGDGQCLAVIGRLGDSRAALALVGEPGSGKTHLAHRIGLYLAQHELIDFGFYFDFGLDFYSANTMLEMIAPVLGLTPDRKSEIRAKLSGFHCCFVLDDLREREDLDEEALFELMDGLMRELIADGHIVIITGRSRSHPLSSGFSEIQLSPLPPIEQQILAADCLRARNLAVRDLGQDWMKLLPVLRGHPFLIKQTLPLLSAASSGELIEKAALHLAQDRSPVDSFYEWQWAGIPFHWRRLLLMCSRVEGLLLEMLMIACDQKEPFAPARSLFALLGADSAAFSEGLELWERAGFIVRSHQGRIVDPRCLLFLADKQPPSIAGDAESNSELLHFSQVLCEGIRLLSPQALDQRNQTISHYLLMNRRQWVEHFERLWFAHDYRGFIGAKQAFDQLLLQAKIGEESAAWSLSLLERSPEISAGDEIGLEARLSWLALAVRAMGKDQAHTHARLVSGAAAWQSWFDRLPAPIDRSQAPLFQQVSVFLAHFYQKSNNWTAAIAVGEKAYRMYMQYRAWPRAIQTLKSLTRYHLELGESERALDAEEKILADIPYADSPPGFYAQQLFDVALARVTRGASAPAQSVLDKLKAMDEARRFGDLLEGLQADIYYQQARYADSMPYYCKLWTLTLQTQQQPYLEQLKQRFQEMEERLGSESFNRYLDREMARDVIRPHEYAAS